MIECIIKHVKREAKEFANKLCAKLLVDLIFARIHVLPFC